MFSFYFIIIILTRKKCFIFCTKGGGVIIVADMELIAHIMMGMGRKRYSLE